MNPALIPQQDIIARFRLRSGKIHERTFDASVGVRFYYSGWFAMIPCPIIKQGRDELTSFLAEQFVSFEPHVLTPVSEIVEVEVFNKVLRHVEDPTEKVRREQEERAAERRRIETEAVADMLKREPTPDLKEPTPTAAIFIAGLVIGAIAFGIYCTLP